MMRFEDTEESVIALMSPMMRVVWTEVHAEMLAIAHGAFSPQTKADKQRVLREAWMMIFTRPLDDTADWVRVLRALAADPTDHPFMSFDRQFEAKARVLASDFLADVAIQALDDTRLLEQIEQGLPT